MPISVAEARQRLARAVRALPVEWLPLSEADGRIVLGPVTACRSLPETDSAALDGYAVRVADLASGGTAALRISGAVTAGQSAPPSLTPGHCVAVTTGAPLPPEADAVVPKEAVNRDGDRVMISVAPPAWGGVRRAGQEVRTGDILLSPGSPVDARNLERLSGQGVTRLPVSRRARVHLVATGDELVRPAGRPGPGQRIASNLPMLEALVRACGGQVTESHVVPDEPEQLRRSLAAALDGDLVLTSGGTLRGAKDLTKQVLTSLGAIFVFDGVAMRPGSSCALATVGQSMVLCLPGSPGAAYLGFAALARPLLRGLHGRSQPIPTFEARLGDPVEPAAEDTVLVSGVVRDTTSGLEFLRRGQGWPGLGLLPPSGVRQFEESRIAVEPLPTGDP
jgi:molybdopterin molybdotransferase